MSSYKDCKTYEDFKKINPTSSPEFNFIRAVINEHRIETGSDTDDLHPPPYIMKALQRWGRICGNDGYERGQQESNNRNNMNTFLHGENNPTVCLCAACKRKRGNKKPFNLQKALDGDTVITREGHLVKIAGYNPDASGSSVLLGWIDGEYMNWYSDGRVYDLKESERDLFMAPKKRTVWVNLYFQGSAWFDNKERADVSADITTFGGRIGNKAYPIEIEE